MVTTDLCKCLIRKRLVAATPEEKVRQLLLEKMIHHLGFPKGLISVEKAVGSRRYDIVCYTKEMTPLLLIECKKAEESGAASQACGYNDSLKAPFICIAAGEKIQTFWQEKDKINSVPFLPQYPELYAISRNI
jgi:type I site-specific restriction endonuclease